MGKGSSSSLMVLKFAALLLHFWGVVLGDGGARECECGSGTNQNDEESCSDGHYWVHIERNKLSVVSFQFQK
jgi:hypothetical protein